MANTAYKALGLALALFCCPLAAQETEFLISAIGEERFDYPQPQESYTWKDLNEKAPGWDGKYPPGMFQNARLNKCWAFQLNGKHYCQLRSYADILDEGNFLIASVVPLRATEGNFWEIALLIMDSVSPSSPYWHKDFGKKLDARLEKTGDDEYVVSITQWVSAPDGLLKKRFRYIKAYIKGRCILAAGRRDYALGARIAKRPDMTEASFREEQLEALRTLHRFYFGDKKGISTRPATEEDEARLMAYRKWKKDEDRWEDYATLMRWRRAWLDEERKRPGKFFYPFWHGHANEFNLDEAFGLPKAPDTPTWPNVNEGALTGKQAAERLFSRAAGRKMRVTDSGGGSHHVPCDAFRRARQCALCHLPLLPPC